MILNPPPPFTIRPMELDDIEMVMRIEADSFPRSWSAAGYRHELTENRKAHYVVLEHAEASGAKHIIGYAGHWIVVDEAHISTIALAPRWRGQGLGALLLLRMIYHAIAQKAAVVSLEVRDGNEAAQQLYLRHGFVWVGRRRGYYRDTGEDALLMDLDLTKEETLANLEAQREALWQRLQQQT